MEGYTEHAAVAVVGAVWGEAGGLAAVAAIAEDLAADNIGSVADGTGGVETPGSKRLSSWCDEVGPGYRP